MQQSHSKGEFTNSFGADDCIRILVVGNTIYTSTSKAPTNISIKTFSCTTDTNLNEYAKGTMRENDRYTWKLDVPKPDTYTNKVFKRNGNKIHYTSTAFPGVLYVSNIKKIYKKL